MEYCVLDATHLQITWVRVTYLVGLGVTLDPQIELMHLRIRDIMTDNIVATMIRTLTQSTGTPLMINQHNKPDGLRTNLNRINSRSSLKLRTIGIIRGNKKIAPCGDNWRWSVCILPLSGWGMGGFGFLPFIK